MYPIAFEIGSLSIRWYGVMAAIGFLAATFLLERNRKFANLTKDQCSNMLLMGLISGIIGARIFYVVKFFKYFRDDLWRIVRIDQGGLVFYGGFLLALAVIVIYTRSQKLDTVRVLDVLAPSLALGHAFGRIGCFLNGCCYGKAATVPWGVSYPPGSYPAQMTDGTPLHPVQLYEAGEMILLFFLFNYLLKHTRRGVPMSLYLLIYGCLRFLNELFRGDNPHFLNLFTPAQIIGFLLIPCGIILLIFFLKNERKTSDIQH
jgi:phosphatidylglycerol:prolipoprotein diacylglycerol transferase